MDSLNVFRRTVGQVAAHSLQCRCWAQFVQQPQFPSAPTCACMMGAASSSRETPVQEAMRTIYGQNNFVSNVPQTVKEEQGFV